MGTIVGTRGNNVFVVWDDEEDVNAVYDSSDLRYCLDRGLLRLTAPPRPRRERIPREKLVCPTCGHSGRKRCGCPRAGARKPEEWGTTPLRGIIMRQVPAEGNENKFHPRTLTGDAAHGKLASSSLPTDRKGMTMAEETQTEAAVTTLSPKDLAARVGTDAKGFRRFLRSDHSGVEDAGQGNRYAFTEAEADSLVERYQAWTNGKGERKPRSETEGAKRNRSKGKKGDVAELDFESAKRREAAEASVDEDLEEIDLDSLDLDLDEEPDEAYDTHVTETATDGAVEDDDEELEEL